jgi:Leucine Rich repeat
VDVACGLEHSAVTVLNLAKNCIANASPLMLCTTLQEIDLSSNNIDNDWAIQLSSMAPQLERLHVNCCQIGTRGFRSLLAAPFRTLSCELLTLVEESLDEYREVSQVLIELLPTATMRSLAVTVRRNVRVNECTRDQELQILHALAKNKSLLAFDDRNNSFLQSFDSRRTVRHICLRNSVGSYSTAIVPAVFTSWLCKSTGAHLVYRMLRDNPDWITRQVIVGIMRPPAAAPQPVQRSAHTTQLRVVHQTRRRRLNPPPSPSAVPPAAAAPLEQQQSADTTQQHQRRQRLNPPPSPSA